MSKSRFIRIQCCMLLLLGRHFCRAQEPLTALDQLPWHTEELAPGLQWQFIHTEALFESRQHINILRVGKARKISLDYEQTTLKNTSQFALEEEALAAVNAGFFNMKNGGSVTFMKVDDQVTNHHTHQGVNITTHCLVIDEQDHLSIVTDADTQWLARPENFDDVLFTGPLLIESGKSSPQESKKFVDNRHPRTCACTLSNEEILLITVDGRTTEAEGMNLHELTRFLLGLDCHHAINLDGGGSTTMWIRQRGIVNHPSDNGMFDPGGERRVANVLLIH